MAIDDQHSGVPSELHDPLTGLPNRRLLVERVEHAMLRSRRSGAMVAIIVADLNGLKVVNDTYGHQIGDGLLIAVAQRLTRSLRPADTVARLSGGEFVIVCEDLGDAVHVEVIATRIDAALAATFTVSGVEVELAATVGIAFAGLGEDMPEQLLYDSGLALRQLGHHGGGGGLVDLRQQHLADNRTTLERDLRGALRRGELRVEYQPIVRTEDGRLAAVEALLRWDHPVHGLVPPATLIPLADRSGLIIDIGRWVLGQACADRRRWSLKGPDELGVAVNISARQLMAPDFVAGVEAVLVANQTPPELLTLEITERAFLEDSQRVLTVLLALKRLGVMVALDDFGAGYSSLNYLTRFPLDVVKIYQGAGAELVMEGTGHAVVVKVIELAHLLGIAVVTEGVETSEQRQEAARLGSESAQGYYFSPPMSAGSLDVVTAGCARSVDLRFPVPPGRSTDGWANSENFVA
jgi:diguanylate cyclase (GGDEF)-like protein